MSYKLYVVYIEGDENNYKFLVRNNIIVYDYNDKEKFIGCRFENKFMYKERPATQKDLDEALINNI